MDMREALSQAGLVSKEAWAERELKEVLRRESSEAALILPRLDNIHLFREAARRILVKESLIVSFLSMVFRIMALAYRFRNDPLYDRLMTELWTIMEWQEGLKMLLVGKHVDRKHPDIQAYYARVDKQMRTPLQ